MSHLYFFTRVNGIVHLAFSFCLFVCLFLVFVILVILITVLCINVVFGLLSCCFILTVKVVSVFFFCSFLYPYWLSLAVSFVSVRFITVPYIRGKKIYFYIHSFLSVAPLWMFVIFCVLSDSIKNLYISQKLPANMDVLYMCAVQCVLILTQLWTTNQSRVLAYLVFAMIIFL